MHIEKEDTMEAIWLVQEGHKEEVAVLWLDCMHLLLEQGALTIVGPTGIGVQGAVQLHLLIT